MKGHPKARRAFSLVELLVVMLIIAVVIAIILPALGSARTSAKVADTRQLMTTLSQGISQFKLDNRRLPGHFAATRMGSTDNATRGFSEMQNVLLELSTGSNSLFDPGAAPSGVGPTLLVGPGNTADAQNQVYVALNRFGASGAASQKAYFAPSSKYLPNWKWFSDRGFIRQGVAAAATDALPDLVDSFGTPILLWRANEAATGDISAAADFARLDSGPANAPVYSRFYWNSNSAFLTNGTATVGAKRIQQSDDPTGVVSMLGEAQAGNRAGTLMGILGNPSSPADVSVATASILPTAPRGSFVIHAAGADGLYMSSKSKGAALAGAGPLHYGLSFKNLAGQPWPDKKSIDLAAEFDDLFIAGN